MPRTWPGHKSFWMLIGVLLAATVASSSWAISSLRQGNQKSAQREIVTPLTKSLENHIYLFQSAAQSLGTQQQIVELLKRPNRERQELAITVLEAIQRTVHSDFLYVMDTTGEVVAATADPQIDMMGKNYSFRPYFRRALLGEAFIYPARGVTTRELGLYFSGPVKDGDRVIGVVALKTNSSYFQEFLNRTEGLSMITTEDGIVFCANDPDLLYRSTTPLAEKTRAEILTSRQFGETSTFVPFPLNGTTRQTAFSTGLHVVESRQIENTPWTLYHLLPGDAHFKLTLSQLILMASGAVLFLLLFSVILDLVRNIQRRKQIERELQEYQDHLEDLVRQQTAALRDVNSQLMQDIQERRRAEDRLRASEAMLADAQRLARLGNWVWENGVFSWSDELYRICKRTQADGIPEGGWESLVTPEYLPAVRRAFTDTLEGKAPYSLEYDIRCADGELRHVLSRGWVERDDDGAPMRMIATILDITEQKLAEEGMIRAERMAAVGTLAGGVAHEFNNINAIILGYAELAKNDCGEELGRYIEPILKASLRAKSITQNLLSFSGRHAGLRRMCSLSDVARETLALVESEFRSDGIRIETDLPPVPDTQMESSQISQVILNLLVNARHALIGRPQPRILLQSGAVGERIWLKVSDNGCGIPGENLAKIFTPFYSTKGEHATGNSPQAKVRGTGLGLSVSHTLVAQHEGSLTVESRVDEGTAFTISLPIRLENREKTEKLRLRLAERSASTVMVLDDEIDIRNVVGMVLAKMKCRPLQTDDGEEALKRIAEGGVDAVLVDLQMPKMNGLTFLGRLQRLKLPQKPVILVFTGRHSRELTLDMTEYGVFDTLAKPFNIDEISDKIAKALDYRSRNLAGK